MNVHTEKSRTILLPCVKNLTLKAICNTYTVSEFDLLTSGIFLGPLFLPKIQSRSNQGALALSRSFQLLLLFAVPAPFMVQSGFGTGWSYTLGWVEGNLPFDVFRSSLALPSLLTPTALRFSLPFSGVHTRDLLQSFTCWGTLGFKRQFPFQTKGNHKRRQMCQRASSMMETPSLRPTSPAFLSAWISPLLKPPCLSLWNKRTRPTCTTWGSFYCYTFYVAQERGPHRTQQGRNI